MIFAHFAEPPEEEQQPEDQAPEQQPEQAEEQTTFPDRYKTGLPRPQRLMRFDASLTGPWPGHINGTST